MATIKSYSDLQQSKKLAEILPLESADMVYVHTIDLEGDEHYNIDFRNNQPLFEDDISAWSLAALLGVIPKPDLVQNSERTWLVRSWVNSYPWSVGGYSNPVDACYEMILKLNELKML